MLFPQAGLIIQKSMKAKPTSGTGRRQALTDNGCWAKRARRSFFIGSNPIGYDPEDSI